MESIQNYEIYAYKQNATVVTSDWKKVIQRWEMSVFFWRRWICLFRLEQWNRCVYRWPWHWKNSNRIVTMLLRCVPCQQLIVLVRSVNRRQSSQEIHPFNHSIRVNYLMSPPHSHCWRNSTERHSLDRSILCLRLYIEHFSSAYVYLCI